MSNEIKTVLLIGANGNLGASVLQAFTQQTTLSISVLQRPASTATYPPTITVIKSDFTPSSLEAAFKGQDAIVSLAGAGQLEDQKTYIDAAIAAGVKRFVPSDFGGDLSGPRALEVSPWFQTKVDVRRYLETKASEWFSWTAFTNGPFFDWGLRVGFLGFDLNQRKVTLFDGGETKFSASNLALIGEAVVKSLSPEYAQETRNKEVYIESQTTTQRAILAELEKQTGQTWAVEHVDTKALIKERLTAYHAGEVHPGTIYPLIQALNFSKDLDEAGNHHARSWNDRLGLTTNTLEDDIKAVLA